MACRSPGSELMIRSRRRSAPSTTQRAFDDAGIDDVRSAGPGGEGAGRAGAGVIEGLGVASGHGPGQVGRAAVAAPRLGQDGSGTVGT